MRSEHAMFQAGRSDWPENEEVNMPEAPELDQAPPLGLTPILTVDGAEAAIAFYTHAFGAREIARLKAPNGTGKLIHARMSVAGSTFVFMDEFPELKFAGGGTRAPTASGSTSVTLHLQVTDADALWSRAVAAGASVVVPLQEQFWGEIYGRLRDPFGHEWTIAQTLHRMSEAEVEQAAVGAFS
jgi:PhnB protein